MAGKQMVFRGDRLKEARRAKRMTQGELAEKLSLTRAQVTNLETSRSEPSMTTLTLAAYLLDVTTDWLLDMTAALTPVAGSAELLPFID